MTRIVSQTAPQHRASHGFTLLEILMVIVTIALLAAVALPQYQRYAARSRAAELALKFDAVRTGIQVATKSGDDKAACTSLVNTVQPANLQSTYAQLALHFEAVPGGFTPVLTMCASSATQGQRGVEVTREAHNLLSRNSVISQGAVMGASAVSFSVRLSGETALCTVLPPVGIAKAACASSSVPTNNGGGTSTTPIPANIPSSGASAPGGPASVPAKPASGPASVTQPLATGSSCPVVSARTVSRQAMQFAGKGHVTSTSSLGTGGDLPGFSAEVVVTGDAKNGPEATLMSYATDQAYRGFSLWGPQSLHVEIGSMNYQTGVNVEDGKDHRLTMSWQQSGGTLVLYDNGREVWRKLGVNTGGTIGGNGRLMIGEKDESAYWGPSTFLRPYSGTIVNAALARQVVTGAQVASGPLHNVFQANSGLLTDVVMGADGKPMDTTGRAAYVATGSVNAKGTMVEKSVYSDANCP